MWDTSTFLGVLTPKFYVALTGTSSLISGLILIFEWWYFRKYGTSFIEQMSLSSLGLWAGGGGGGGGGGDGAGSGEAECGECKVWRNPMSLLRGAEYSRLWTSARRAPLTYYDMNLSAQEHQAWFGGTCGGGPAEEALSRAWREREPAARVACARAALASRPDCAAAMLLLAEEDAPTVAEAERVLRRAWRAGEAACRALGGAGAGGAGGALGGAARREAAVLAHVKRRAAMCARRLGRVRDAARMFRELARDAPPALAALHVHDNLLEALLEQRLYADAAALLARLEDAAAPPTATSLYTAALLRARSLPAADYVRVPDHVAEAIQAAVEFNPHVWPYLVERRALTFPPEHLVRRGESEALAYAFWHAAHWRRAEPALRVLAALAPAHRAPRRAPPAADAELLAPRPPPARRAPLLPLAAALCLLTALTALTAHRCSPLPALPALPALDPAALLTAF